MELSFDPMASLPTLFTFLLFVFMVLRLIMKRARPRDETLNLPPGPRRLPLIGNLHQLLGSLPHRGLRALAKQYGPIMYLHLGELPTVVVSSPQLAKEVFKTHDVIFASKAPTMTSRIISYDYNDIIFSPYGERWRQLRKIGVNELLHAKRVHSFRSVREEEVSNLVNWVGSQEGSVINLTKKVYSLVFGMTSRAAFGGKSRDQELFISLVQDVTKVIVGSSIADLFPSNKLLKLITGAESKIERLCQQVDKVVQNIIEDHKEARARSNSSGGTNDQESYEDLVHILLNLQENGYHEFPITTDHIKALIFDVFSAGSETSAATIDWAMAHLIKNPKAMKKAQAEVREVFKSKGRVDESGINELQFLKLVIKETLRLNPIAPLGIPRICAKRCSINGFDVSANMRLIVNAWAVARDPDYWTEPESFIPERFLDCSRDFKGNDFEYIPFGAGRRICPGMSFAIASIELPLASLLYHFDWKLPNGMKNEDLDMSEGFGATVRRKDDLCLIPTSYHPSSVA